MKTYKFLFVLVLFGISIESLWAISSNPEPGQLSYQLILQNTFKPHKTDTFNQGDMITILLRGEKWSRVRGQLTEISMDSIRIDQNTYSISDIQAIKEQDKKGLMWLKIFLFTLGIPAILFGLYFLFYGTLDLIFDFGWDAFPEVLMLIGAVFSAGGALISSPGLINRLKRIRKPSRKGKLRGKHSLMSVEKKP